MKHLILSLLLFSGLATRAATLVPLMVDTNGVLAAPTNFIGALRTNAQFAAAITALATNSAGDLAGTSNSLVTQITAATAGLASTNQVDSRTNELRLLILAATNGLHGLTLTWTNALTAAASAGEVRAMNTASNVSVVATSGLWGNWLTASNVGHASASNAAYTAAAAYATAADLTVSNAVYWAVSNATYAAAVANTLSATQALAQATAPAAYFAPGNVTDGAQRDAYAYARWVSAAGGPNLATNGEAARLAAALDLVRRNATSSNLVDVGFFGAGQTITSGTNLPFLRGRIGMATAVSYSPAGLWFNGTGSVVNLLGLPDLRTNTICVRVGTDTNLPSSAFAAIFTLTHSNAYTNGMSSALLWNSSAFYPHTYYTNYDIGEAVFARSLNPSFTEGYSEGLYRGQRQFRNVGVSVNGLGGTNGPGSIITWVDGILGQWDTNVSLPESAAVTRLTLGMRADNPAVYTNPLRGYIQQAWIFDTVLSSNQHYWVDRAMSVAAGEVPFVVQGDSITEFSGSQPGVEWPQQMWATLGALTNSVTVHNHAYSGRTAFALSNDMAQIFWSRPGSVAAPLSYYAVLAGVNDIIGGNYATNVFRCLSNMCWVARTNGAITLVGTLLPMGTNNANYTAGRATEISALNALLKDTTNNPLRPFSYVIPFDSAIPNAGDTNILSDGLHPTPPYKKKMGEMVGTNVMLWRY